MAIIEQNQFTHLVSKNKCICIKHQRLAYFNNICIAIVFKLINSIDLETNFEKKYKLAKILIDSNNFKVSNNNNVNFID